MSSRKTRRSSSAQGTRESGGRGGLRSGRGVDVDSRGVGAATGQAGGGVAGGPIPVRPLEGGPPTPVGSPERAAGGGASGGGPRSHSPARTATRHSPAHRLWQIPNQGLTLVRDTC